MKTAWFKGVSDKNLRTEIRQDYLKALPSRLRLKELLEDKIETARTMRRGSSTYDSPNWALLQADSMGYERALFEVISLIYDEKVQKVEK